MWRYIQIVYEEVKIASSRNKGNKALVVLEPVDASGKNLVLALAIEKMTVLAFHVLRSNARGASSSELPEVEQRNLQNSNTRTNISLTISRNHGILIVDGEW